METKTYCVFRQQRQLILPVSPPPTLESSCKARPLLPYNPRSWLHAAKGNACNRNASVALTVGRSECVGDAVLNVDDDEPQAP